MADQSKTKTDKKPVSLTDRINHLLESTGYEIVLPDSDAVKLFIKLFIVLASLSAAMMLLIVRADLRPSAIVQGLRDKYAFTHASGSGFPIDIHGSRTVRSSGITNGTALLTDTTFTIYDSKGREVISESHHFASPSMECSGKYSLLFDRMGKEFILRNLSGVSCSGTVDDSIICGDVSASGRFAFVTNSELTNAKIAVYSPDGNLLYKWKSVDNKISDITVSPSGKYVALCGVSTRKGLLVSSVIVQQVGAKKNLMEITFEGSLTVDIRFDGNSRIAVVSDDFAAYLDVDSGNVKKYSYDGRTLNCYDISDDGDMALVFSENSDGRNSSVVVIDAACNELAHIDTSMTSPFVDVEDGFVNLLNQNEVTCYHYSGQLIKSGKVPTDCQEIFTSQGRLLAKGVSYLAELNWI